QRAPFHVMGQATFASLPDPNELELLAETVLVAAINGRTAVIQLLIERGFPIDYDGWGGTSLLRLAIGQKNVSMVETLVSLGADLDKKGEWPHASAREVARMIVKHEPKHPDLRRILALCGAGTFEDALAEIDRLRTSPPPLTDRLKQVLEL